MFCIQSFFTRISHYKPSLVMLYGDVLFTPLYSREVIRGCHLTQYLAQLFHQWGFGADN